MSSSPKHISDVVRRVLAGLPPAAPAGEGEVDCRRCGAEFGESAAGTLDGCCPACTSFLSRAGRWHTIRLDSRTD